MRVTVPLDTRPSLRVFALGIRAFALTRGVRDVDSRPLCGTDHGHGVGREAGVHVDVPLGVRGRARLAARSLREGESAAMERRGTYRLVAAARSRKPRAAPRREHADLRLRALSPHDRAGARDRAHALPGVATVAVHA